MSEIVAIDKIQTEYFQKSTFFIYPILKIPKELQPINTYLSWKKIKPEKCHIFCLFDKIRDYKLRQLEKKFLLGNIYFHKLYESQSYLLYEFDLSSYENNFEVFFQGEYSRLSPFFKKMILTYHDKDSDEYKYAHCYLNPSLYYETYSEILDVDISLIEDAGELISKPDLEKEMLKSKIKFDNVSPS